MREFRFGAVVRGASSGAEWTDKARRVEDLGFDVMLVPDHLVGPRLAPVAALAAAAAVTTRLTLGTLVFANDFRHPAVLAKETATLDLLSGGRLEVGLGTGWMAADYRGAGLPYDPPGVRVGRLAEAVAVLKGLWGAGPFTFHGEHYHVDELDLQPTPARPPRLLLGGGGPRMLRLAAREADVVNLGMRVRSDGTGPDGRDGGPAAFLAKLDTVRQAAGERPIELGTSVMQVGARKPEAGWSAVDSSAQGGTPQVLLGTTADIVAQLRYWRDEHGISYFVVHREEDLEAFAPVVAELGGQHHLAHRGP